MRVDKHVYIHIHLQGPYFTDLISCRPWRKPINFSAFLLRLLDHKSLGSQCKLRSWVLPCCLQLPAVLHPQDTSGSSVPLWPLLVGCFPVSLPTLGQGTPCPQEGSHRISPHSIPWHVGRHIFNLNVVLSFSPIWLFWCKKFRVSPDGPASILPWLIECTEEKKQPGIAQHSTPSKPHPACGYHSPESRSLWFLPVKGFMEKSAAEVTELQRQRNHKAHKGTPQP